jgi:hypothetical protein
MHLTLLAYMCVNERAQLCYDISNTMRTLGQRQREKVPNPKPNEPIAPKPLLDCPHTYFLTYNALSYADCVVSKPLPHPINEKQQSTITC